MLPFLLGEGAAHVRAEVVEPGVRPQAEHGAQALALLKSRVPRETEVE